jgi:predicted permease
VIFEAGGGLLSWMDVLLVVLTILGSLLAGVAAERRHGARAAVGARGVLKLLLYVLTPPVAFLNVAHLEITADVGGGIVIGWAALVLAGLAAWAVGRWWLRLPPPTNGVLVNSSLQGNTGYLGLPLCVALLGGEHLSQAVAYDVFVQAPVLLLGVFGVGAAMGTRAGSSTAERLRAFVLKNPPLIAVVAGLLAPAALAPAGLVEASRVLVYASLPFGFFAAGVILAEHAEEGRAALRPRFERSVGAAILLRLVVAPLLLFLLAAPFIDLPPAYLLLAAMPAGLSGLTVAHAYGLDLRFAASAVAWTTAVGVTAAVGLGLAV